MSVPLRYVLDQGPVLAALGRVALSALKGEKPGGKATVQAPGPWVTATLPPRPADLIATYVRSSWSNKAGPVDADVFARMRAKYGQRAQFNIKELGEEG